MTNQAPAGAVATPNAPATCALGTAQISTRISSLLRAALVYQRVLPLALRFQQTKTKAVSKATIAGPNSWQTDAGSRWTSAKHGKIRSLLIITLATTRRT